jgi:hypothetical protein
MEDALQRLLHFLVNTVKKCFTVGQQRNHQCVAAKGMNLISSSSIMLDYAKEETRILVCFSGELFSFAATTAVYNHQNQSAEQVII